MIKENCSKIGFVAKPHGIEGQVILRLNGAFAEVIEPEGPLFVNIDGILVPFFIEEIRPAGEMAYVKLEFVDNKIQASRLIGREAYLPADAISLPDNFIPNNAALYVGFLLEDRQSGFQGEIVEYIENKANQLFRVISGNKEYLIPAQAALIKKVKKRSKKLMVDLPEGFFDQWD